MIFPTKNIQAFCLFWPFNKRIHTLGPNQVFPIVMEENFLHGVYMHKMGIYVCKVWKTLLVQKIIACLIIQKMLF